MSTAIGLVGDLLGLLGLLGVGLHLGRLSRPCPTSSELLHVRVELVVRHNVPIGHEDPRQTARDDLEAALAWAAAELGDHYTIAPL